MQPSFQPILQDLVLIGGGHAHAIVLKMFGMKPIAGVRLTLITETSHTPYSGMLPGHVAGFYDFDESHIDLRRLTNFAQAQLFLDRAIGLDLVNNKVLCANRPPVAFDWLSIDIGSTPAMASIPGAKQYAIPAKPVPQFLANWNQLLKNLTPLDADNNICPLRLGIVGGGAGGVELALSVQARLSQIYHNLSPIDERDRIPEIHLFHRGDRLLPNHNRGVQQRLTKILHKRGIHLHLRETVSQIEKNPIQEPLKASKNSNKYPIFVQCESGLRVECDRVFWVTQASAPSWLAAAGLTTDAAGFILVNQRLQSISHPQIFAAGDVATLRDHPRPKAGVFAVRQGKPLFENLQRSLLGKPLKSYYPQKAFLSLIGTGTGEAIASRGSFACGPSRFLWKWKESLDRQFMQRFIDLPEMNLSHNQLKLKQPVTLVNQEDSTDAIATFSDSSFRCSGCASKISHTTLQRVLNRLKNSDIFALDTFQNNINFPEILIGIDSPDDAAVVRVPGEQLMVHTVDYFRTIISDPFIFGQIAANHCLNDIFTMGATAQTALAIVTIPYGTAAKIEETLFQVLAGASKVLAAAKTVLIGGHSTEGLELSFGLACQGLVEPKNLLCKGRMQPGNLLILTKALGTGTLFAAEMRRKAKGRWIETAIESMLLSNKSAAECFLEYNATACTDITGFGLLGHLVEMIEASQVTVELDLDQIPILPGAKETIKMGIFSSLHPENMRSRHQIMNLDHGEIHDSFPLLFDPQTSGGLLAAIPPEKAKNCLVALKNLGYCDSKIIAQVKIAETGNPPITLKTGFAAILES